VAGEPDPLEEHLLEALRALEPSAALRAAPTEVEDLWRAQVDSRQADYAARWLQQHGRSFYTIGSAGHESNAAVALALRVDDPALLHYRSGAFYLARAAQAEVEGLRDVMLGVVAAAVEPIAGGRHKVFGRKELAVIPMTSTIASHLPRAVGVALAIQNYLAGKTTTIATLKCLGAPGGLVFRVYLLQVLVLAGSGILAGLVLGQAAPWLLRTLATSVLPFQVAGGFYPMPLLIAAGCGLLTALTFVIWPLAQARAVSPAGMFRALIAPPRTRPPTAILMLLGLSIAGLAALALLGVADRRLGLIFVAVALVAAALLAGLALLLLRGVRLIGRRGGARSPARARNVDHSPSAATSAKPCSSSLPPAVRR